MKSLKTLLAIVVLTVLCLPSLSFGEGGNHHHNPPRHHEFHGEYQVYGPKAFSPVKGKPVIQKETFAGPAKGKYFFLKVQNGDNAGRHKVDEARIWLNNRPVDEIIRFHHHERMFEVVQLQSSNTLAVEVKGHTDSYLTITIVGYDRTPPRIAITNPADGSATDQPNIAVSGSVRDNTVTAVTVNGISASVTGKTFQAAAVPLSLGANTITATATDSGGNQASSSVNVYRKYVVPNITGMTKANAEAAIVAAGLEVGTESSAYDASVPAGIVISQTPAAKTIVTPSSAVNLVISLGPPTVTVPSVTSKTQSAAALTLASANLALGTVTKAYNSTVAKGRVISQNPAANTLVGLGTAVSIVLSLGPADPVIPPDPATIAPAINGTVATTVAASTAFLYTGSNPVQTGVASGTIEDHRATLVRGKVLGKDGNPLSGVTITILNHPEFGQTVSRTDGMFDMVVNGGGILTVNYARNGYMSAQRQVATQWNGHATASDVVLLQYDTKATPINLGSSIPVQVARGGVITDVRGTRQATILFSQGTTASMVYIDGTSEPLTILNVRATEFTVGDNGPKAMPAELPPASAYTYAVELSVDEAVNNGATSVQFSKPAYLYLENFLNFPVGGNVPTGYYDPAKAAWIPSDNGVIVKILNINNGMAVLDTDGSGQEADAAKLALLNITDEERSQLATLYSQGQSLWRVGVKHFSSWDCNWGWGPPDDAEYPPQRFQTTDPERIDIDDPCTECGSIIEVQNQTLGESLSITGTPFSLNYSSSRVPGRRHYNTVTIPLSGSSIPASLQSIVLNVSVGGRVYSYAFAPSANLNYTFSWDGRDAYGRYPSGYQTARIDIGYVYGGTYQYVTRFGYNGNGPISANSNNFTITLWNHSSAKFKYSNEIVRGMGGWSIDAHHTLDIISGTLHAGTGQKRDVPLLHATSTTGTITTVAGMGGSTSTGDGGPATQASLDTPVNVAIGTDKSIYIREANRIRRIGVDGIITTVAGNGETETAGSASGDEGPATAAALSGGYGLSPGADNSLYLSDSVRQSVRRIGTDGVITTVASGLHDPYGVFATVYGPVFFSEKSGNLIRIIDNNGRVAPYSGCWLLPFQFVSSPHGLVWDGSVFFYAETGAGRITKLGCGSVNFAGNGDSTYNGDFGSATGISLNSPEGVAIGPDRSVYIADTLNNRVRRVDQNGNLTTIAGNGGQGYNGDGVSALSASLNKPTGLAVAGDGSVYIADSANNRVRRVSFVSTISQDYIVASEDGSEVYIFDSTGRHLRTVHPLTGATIHQFGYNANGFLISITDGNDNVTTIERDASSNPSAIVAPFGQRTALTVDPNGYISSVANPAGETAQMTYTADGLLTSLTDPKGNASRFSYDPRGFLTKDQNAAGGSWSLAQQTLSAGVSQVSITSALGRTTTYLTKVPDSSYQTRTITSPTGSQATQFISNDFEKTTSDDAAVIQTSKTADPRFAMQSPLASTTITTPAGLSLSVKRQRSTSLSISGNILSTLMQTDYSIINGQTYKSVFDGTQNRFTLTSPAGRTATSLINNLGRPLSVTLDSSLSPITFSYDSYGRLAQAAQGDQLAAYFYDSSGRVASIADVQGNTTQFGYDLADRVKLMTLPSGRTYGFAHDANGNRTSITMPNGATHALGYTVVNLGSTYTPPANTPYSWQYSLDKEWTRTLLPGGRTVEAAYDSGGRSLGIIYPEATVSLNYGDTTDRVTHSIRTPAGGGASQVTSFTYDGSLVTGMEHSGAASGKFTYTHDNNFLLGRIDFISSSNVLSTAITRDADGLITACGPFTFTRGGPAGSTNRINDTASLQASATTLQGDDSSSYFAYLDHFDPSRGFKSGKSEPWKAPLYSLLARKNIERALFDPVDTVKRTELRKSFAAKSAILMLAMNDFSSPERIAIVVAPSTIAPNVVGMTETDAEAAILAAGITVGSVTTISSDTVPSGVVISQYPAGGTVTASVDITVSSGPMITTPNVVGMTQAKAQATILASNLAVGVISTTICSAGQPGTVISQSPAAGTSAESNSAVSLVVCSANIGLDINITYDSLGRVSTRSHTVNGSSIYSIQLSYDSRGNISQKTEAAAGTTSTWGYNYDSDGQLTSVTKNGASEEQYTYDVNGNRTGYQRASDSTASTFDTQDRLVQMGGTAYAFNADGQMTQRGSDTFTYSATGELLQATVSGKTISYAYDSMHRRVAATDSSGAYQYLYGNLDKPFQLTAMRDPAGVLTYYYYDTTGLLFAFDKGGVRYYVATDQVGTPKVVSDATGAVVKYLEYDSFGMPTLAGNPDFILPVGYAGGLTDTTTGLVRFGYRDYDPYAGRWTAKDPIFFKGGQGNLYVYVSNNPINYTDPLGLWTFKGAWSDAKDAASVTLKTAWNFISNAAIAALHDSYATPVAVGIGTLDPQVPSAGIAEAIRQYNIKAAANDWDQQDFDPNNPLKSLSELNAKKERYNCR